MTEDILKALDEQVASMPPFKINMEQILKDVDTKMKNDAKIKNDNAALGVVFGTFFMVGFLGGKVYRHYKKKKSSKK